MSGSGFSIHPKPIWKGVCVVAAHVTAACRLAALFEATSCMGFQLQQANKVEGKSSDAEDLTTDAPTARPLLSRHPVPGRLLDRSLLEHKILWLDQSRGSRPTLPDDAARQTDYRSWGVNAAPS